MINFKDIGDGALIINLKMFYCIQFIMLSSSYKIKIGNIYKIFIYKY